MFTTVCRHYIIFYKRTHKIKMSRAGLVKFLSTGVVRSIRVGHPWCCEVLQSRSSQEVLRPAVVSALLTWCAGATVLSVCQHGSMSLTHNYINSHWWRTSGTTQCKSNDVLYIQNISYPVFGRSFFFFVKYFFYGYPQLCNPQNENIIQKHINKMLIHLLRKQYATTIVWPDNEDIHLHISASASSSNDTGKNTRTEPRSNQL